MWITSSAPRPRRSAKGARFESMVLEVCITPFGSPVVPAGVEELDHVVGRGPLAPERRPPVLA